MHRLLLVAVVLVAASLGNIHCNLMAADDLRLVYLTDSGSHTLRTPLPGGISATSQVEEATNYELQLVGLGPRPGLRTPFGLGLGYTDLTAEAGGVETSVTGWYLRGSFGVGYWHKWLGIEVSGFASGGLADVEQRTGLGQRRSDDPFYYDYGVQAWLTAGFEPGVVAGIGGTWSEAPIEADLGYRDQDFTRNGFMIGAFLAIRIN